MVCGLLFFSGRQVNEMMRKYRTILLVTVVCLLIAAVGYAKTTVPPIPSSSIYVQDYANVLSAETEQQINRVGMALREKTKAQIVVVTVKQLADTTVEEYALELLRGWGVGDQAMNNGVVLLVDTEARQSRVEVGYGLEGALPDGKTGQIQDEYMLPYFKKGDYDGGVLNAYLALAQVVQGEYKVALTNAPAPVQAQETSLFDRMMNFVFAGVLIVLILLDFVFFGGRFTMLILMMLRSRGGGGGGFGGGSGGGGGSSRRW